MRKRQIAARALIALWIAAGARAATGPAGLDIGSGSEIDTGALRSAIERSHRRRPGTG